MEIEDLLSYVPEEKREEAKEFVGGLNPISGVTDKNKAIEFVKSNDIFKSAFDSEVSKGVNTFKETTYPLDLEKNVALKVSEIEKELNDKYNPAISEEQKAMKALQDKIDALQNEGTRDKQLIFARDYVKGKIYPGFDVSPYLGKSDLETQSNLDKALNPYAEFYNGQLETFQSVVDKAVDEKLNISVPGSSTKSHSGRTVTRSDFDNLDPVKKSELMKSGAKIIN